MNKQNFRNNITSDLNKTHLIENDEKSFMSRRKFIALLSASSAFALTSCSLYNDKGKIVQYNKKPDNFNLGRANYFASTCDACDNNCSILVKTREGRPIKIEGNSENPITKGKICVRGQANILNLYDPERIKTPLKKVNSKFNPISWTESLNGIINSIKKSIDSNKEILLISHTSNSPSYRKLLNDFKSLYPTTEILNYELFDKVNKIEATKLCYNSNSIPKFNFNNLKVILSLDYDFLGTEDNFISNIQNFTVNRNIDALNKFSRLYVCEGGMSLTGANADIRIPIRPDRIYDFLKYLIKEIKIRHGNTSLILPSYIQDYDTSNFIRTNGLDSESVNKLIDDLIKNTGVSAVLVGNSQPKESHILGYYLNELLGNHTNMIFEESLENNNSSNEDLKRIFQKINDSKIGVVIHVDTNPVFHFANKYHYETLVNKIETVITLTQVQNETSYFSHYILPINHTIESWNDFQISSNVFSFQQAIIQPIFKTRQKETILLGIIKGLNLDDQNADDFYYDYLKNNWQAENNSTMFGFEQFWKTCIHDGIYLKGNSKYSENSFNKESITFGKLEITNTKLILELKSSLHLGDGRFANNGWLQELPHPISKVTWDNYISISEKTAQKNNLANYDLIEISDGEMTDVFPVFIQSGQADDTLTIELGNGRTNSGTVAENVGFNANKFIRLNGFSRYLNQKIQIKKINKKYELASSVENHSQSDLFLKDAASKRKIIKETTVESYSKDKNILQEKELDYRSITEPHKYTDVKWAMAIDLNKCIGCNACVISCNVENNIPVVGKEQVMKGREMMWMRIDRYYTGSEENPKVSFQPMLCQHCDNAPCENVCPVVATTHSPDGLNQMTYNRCVGTKYCSNNCPYKVRRFNFFNFRDYFKSGYYDQEPSNFVLNPEVTVRSRGVMEKCTFCIQRIMDARQRAIEENKTFDGKDVKTACQESCPSNAISFGNVNIKEKDLSKKITSDLSYHVLEELNIKPNVTYIAKLRNLSREEK